MRHIDEDTITQAVIARHVLAGDARLREVTTSLVQHLHAFARDVKLTEAEWDAGLRFLAECARPGTAGRGDLPLLSHALGLTALVTAVNQRKPTGCTEATVPQASDSAVLAPPRDKAAADDAVQPCFVRGCVCTLDGVPVAGAEVRVGGHADAPHAARARSDADGRFLLRTALAVPQPLAHGGPVRRLLDALGRAPWRPAHLHFTISAPGHERLVTQVFRQGDPYLEADAAFGVRRSLVAEWVHHDAGPTPDGRTSAVPFTTLDFAFVLNSDNTGDTP
jgi:hydroxyquinol 1,2-dioxygenase